MIHTSLSPNTERDDILLALKVLFLPWTRKDVSENSAVKKVERELACILSRAKNGSKDSDDPNEQKIFTVDSGRTALFTILKAFGVGSKVGGDATDEVAIQAYTCVAVPEPILWVGAKPLYIDCENDLTMSVADLRKKVTPKTKVIVVQHTFGQPARITEIVAFAREKNIFVIEDCAHALGAEVIDSQTGVVKPVGTFGDAAFFSFGRDKCISSVFGGAIAVSAHASELAAGISKIVETYPMPGYVWVAQQLNHPLVLALAKKTYNFFGLGKIILEIAKRTHLISKAVQRVELSGGKPTFAFHKFSPALARLAELQLSKLPRFTAHRQTVAEEYALALKNSPQIQPPVFVEGHSYLRYTVTAKTPADVALYFKKARAAGIQLGDWYTTVIAPRGVQDEKIGYVHGSCPNAEKLAATTFNLPTHVGVTRDMIETIVRKIFN